jgi:hypothetical protein
MSIQVKIVLSALHVDTVRELPSAHPALPSGTKMSKCLIEPPPLWVVQTRDPHTDIASRERNTQQCSRSECEVERGKHGVCVKAKFGLPSCVSDRVSRRNHVLTKDIPCRGRRETIKTNIERIEHHTATWPHDAEGTFPIKNWRIII